ncbi:FUSC family protein [Aquibacillus salsiterrae]|uniref:Aromatic acid exporter family protein n=1 Tax=Aquibacillus salsiterrae TaxID=2950439 RepID=A0A9X3WFT6_9BACI|nr:aromatic acid exporter family protein [Aquibacillus salsiterrae]MDC3418213.1 aromatic acid exporter family protein [Aquibacillus salsiterrae]
MKLGARMLKTGLAVAIALYAGTLLGFQSPVFAGIAAVFAIQPSIYRSFQTILEQFQANIFGVSVAIAVFFSLGNDPFVIGFTTILVIGICMYLKMSETTISIAIVAVIAVLQTQETDAFLLNALLRFSALTLGIFSAFLVNLIFLPPKYETKLFSKINDTTSDILQWLRITNSHLTDEPSLKTEISRIQDEITRVDQTYLLFKEERTYLKKNRQSKARKLILFRQLIVTMKKSLDVLKSIDRLDNKNDWIPDTFKPVLGQELDKVIHSHERLLLTAMGRIKKQGKEAFQELLEPNIPHLAEALIQVYDKDNSKRLALLPLAAQLMEYHEQLTHLQTLLSSYQEYHQDEHLEFAEKN